MKQKDVVLIIVIAFISGVISFIISGMLITSPDNRSEKVKVVEPISSELAEADTRYFNSDSINPTQLIQIGDQDNSQPL